MNAYATDAVLCPNGQPHEPKFSHFRALHEAMIMVLPIILEAPTALHHEMPCRVQQADDTWKDSHFHVMFNYTTAQDSVFFVENNAEYLSLVQVPFRNTTIQLEMEGKSAVLLLNGILLFSSTSIEKSGLRYARRYEFYPSYIENWVSWSEPVGGGPSCNVSIATAPIEQTLLHAIKNSWSDYTWYETQIDISEHITNASISISTQQANGFLVYIDDILVGETNDHTHGDDSIVLNITMGDLQPGIRRLTFLSESLGYHNLIGRWNGNTGPKLKGITGSVNVTSDYLLTDGRSWRSCAGLSTEQAAFQNGLNIGVLEDNLIPTTGTELHKTSPTWWSGRFRSPSFDARKKSLFLEVSVGRGHFWLNGHDLGRFWNITVGARNHLSMKYYMLPHDYLLFGSEDFNEIILFDVFPDDLSRSRLVLSWIEPTENEAESLLDTVDFPQACI